MPTGQSATENRTFVQESYVRLTAADGELRAEPLARPLGKHAGVNIGKCVINIRCCGRHIE